jgi:hypothetical protein
MQGSAFGPLRASAMLRAPAPSFSALTLESRGQMPAVVATNAETDKCLLLARDLRTRAEEALARAETFRDAEVRQKMRKTGNRATYRNENDIEDQGFHW